MGDAEPKDHAEWSEIGRDARFPPGWWMPFLLLGGAVVIGLLI